jgi:hypothetical protein
MATGNLKEKQEFDYIPYQICPKCDGQGIVSRPPWLAGDITEWSSTQTSYQCDVCHGDKIIPMFVSPILFNEINDN